MFDKPSRRAWQLPVFVFFLFSAIYLFTLPHVFSYDGLCYALDVDFAGPSNWFHPNHLIYTFLMRLLSQVFHAAGFNGVTLFLMQWVNCVLGAAAIGLLVYLLEGMAPFPIAFLGATLLGFSQAFWTETMDPGCYALATLATCAVLWVMRHLLTRRPLLSGVFIGVAILCHQLLTLTIPAAVFLIWKTSPQPSRTLSRFLCALIPMVGIPYLFVAFYFHGGSTQEIVAWMRSAGFASDTASWIAPWWQWSGFQNIYLFMRGTLATLFYFPFKNAAVITFLTVVILATSHSRERSSSNRALRIGLWTWIAVMTAFEFFWSPDVPRFRLLMFPAWIYLLVDAASLWPTWKQVSILSTASLFLFVVNFTAVIKPNSDPLRSRDFLRAIWIDHHLSPDDYLIFAGFDDQSVTNTYVAYFAHRIPARSFLGYVNYSKKMIGPDFDQPFHDFPSFGHRLFIEESLWNPHVQHALEQRGVLPSGALTTWLSHWVTVGNRRAPDGYTLREVRRLKRPNGS